MEIKPSPLGEHFSTMCMGVKKNATIPGIFNPKTHQQQNWKAKKTLKIPK